ncbi:MAG: O-acetyl-ADP-ribose deacetylase [Thermoplasmata archaeon]|jgi:O-acetyl-ADP-ribose deacetylase (regulator of RNase III)
MKECRINNTLFKIKIGDITEENVDAIVNAANSTLLGGGGVDGAIHRKAGSKLDYECLKIREEQYPNGLPTGEAVITSGGNLKARYVIHTVGPIWIDGYHNEYELLRKSYENSLKLAIKYNIKSISFPAISTGAYGFPMDKAAEISINTIFEFLNREGNLIDEVNIVLFNEKIYQEFEKVFMKICSKISL